MKHHDAKVAHGMALLDLDRGRGNWENKVDLVSLDLGSNRMCVLGQVYGHYNTGCTIIKGTLWCRNSDLKWDSSPFLPYDVISKMMKNDYLALLIFPAIVLSLGLLLAYEWLYTQPAMERAWRKALFQRREELRSERWAQRRELRVHRSYSNSSTYTLAV